MQQSPGQVWCVGSVNADFQMRVERRPGLSETLEGRDYTRLSGGKSANVAFLAHRLGLGARLFGQVGEDDLAEQALAPLRAAGVDLRGLRQLPGQATGMTMITVPPDGDKGILWAPNANDQPWPEEAVRAFHQDLRTAPAGTVLVACAEMHVPTLARLLPAAREAGLRIVLDPSPAARIGRELIALADVIVPDAGEAQALTGIECNAPGPAARAAKQLRERGAGIACVKLASGGCVFDDGRQLLHFGAPPAQVLDTTGAGDAFAGTLAVALARGHAAVQAARFGVAAARLAVTGYGSQPAYPDWQQIEAMANRVSMDTNVQRG